MARLRLIPRHIHAGKPPVPCFEVVVNGMPHYFLPEDLDGIALAKLLKSEDREIVHGPAVPPRQAAASIAEFMSLHGVKRIATGVRALGDESPSQLAARKREERRDERNARLVAKLGIDIEL